MREEGRDGFPAMGEGLVESTGERISVVTDVAVAAESIDEAKAEEARQPPAIHLCEQHSSEVVSVNAALDRSPAQRRHRG